MSERAWNFVTIDVSYAEAQAAREEIIALMKPCETEMDLSLALAYYFAARGQSSSGGYTSQVQRLW